MFPSHVVTSFPKEGIWYYVFILLSNSKLFIRKTSQTIYWSFLFRSLGLWNQWKTIKISVVKSQDRDLRGPWSRRCKCRWCVPGTWDEMQGRAAPPAGRSWLCTAPHQETSVGFQSAARTSKLTLPCCFFSSVFCLFCI